MVKRIFLITLSLWLIQNYLFAMSDPTQKETDKIATDFCLLDLDNKQACLADFKARSVVLFFWTTWCPLCRKELKLLNDLYPQLLNDGLEILAINVGERLYKVAYFAKSNKLNYRVLLDEDTSVAYEYEVLGLPTCIIVDVKGFIRFRGYSFPEDNYKDLISQ